VKPSSNYRKLQLRKERVRELTIQEQQRVVGGAKDTDVDGANNTSRCVTTAA